MSILGLITEFIGYPDTEDFRHGVMIEITGLFIEVLLLSVTIPLILLFARRIRTRPIRSTVDFYLFQIFHNIARMFLDMASVTDTFQVLKQEQKRNANFQICAHQIYGNLENILFALNKVFLDAEVFRKEINSKSAADFLRYKSICERCLEEIDRLTTMLMGFPTLQEELFQMRIHVYVLRDLMEEAYEDIQAEGDRPDTTYNVERMASEITKTIEITFQKRRKLIDSMLKHRHWMYVSWMTVSLPYVVVRRWLSIQICRAQGKPYVDFLYPSSEPEILREWRKDKQFSEAEAAELLGVKTGTYRDYESGYKKMERDAFIKFNQYQTAGDKKNEKSKRRPA